MKITSNDTICISTIDSLMRSFPNSFINIKGEFITHTIGNVYFNLDGCKTVQDIKCKIFEWLSRAACKTQPYCRDYKNKQFNKFMLDGINDFLKTSFSKEDMEIIYTKLGNAINHDLTIRFIENGMSMEWLKEQK